MVKKALADLWCCVGVLMKSLVAYLPTGNDSFQDDSDQGCQEVDTVFYRNRHLLMDGLPFITKQSMKDRFPSEGSLLKVRVGGETPKE